MMQRHYTPESYNRRINEWDGDGATYATLPLRTPEEVAARRISDNERTAIALLRQAVRTHAEVDAYVSRLTTDLACADFPAELDHLTYEQASRTGRALDNAVLNLCAALVDHRLSGEEGHRYGFPLSAGEVSPLTDAIVRYHREVANAYATELQRLKLGLK